VVFHLTTPQVVALDRTEEASAVELLAELLLEAVRDGAPVPSGGPALIEADEERD
jgi:hypothetical protein